jgi:hypothetical protein
MTTITKEPLFYFLILGATLFGLYEFASYDSRANNAELDEIIVTEGRIQALQIGFEKVWQRPPTATEQEGLIENFIREEVLYREALAMGLDRDDPIVRKRMNQKITFLSEDLAGLKEPAETELQAYFDANSESYREPTSFSFQQVYLNPDKYGEGAEKVALELLADLQSGEVNVEEAGDTLMLKHQYNNVSEHNIGRELGQQFITGLREIESGVWAGPVVSGFGWHLVNISNRNDGDIPELDQVRELVIRDWGAEKRKQTNAAFYDALRKRYAVTVEVPTAESNP